MPRPVHSHFVDYDQPGTRQVRALCGVLVARKEGTATPTCLTCRDLLLYRDRLVEDLVRPGQRVTPDIPGHAVKCTCRACFDAWFQQRVRP